MKTKSITYLTLTFLIAGCLASCGTVIHTSGRSGKVPPGQTKKIYGHQSARHFAPGQVKKAYGAKSAREFAPGHHK